MLTDATPEIVTGEVRAAVNAKLAELRVVPVCKSVNDLIDGGAVIEAGLLVLDQASEFALEQMFSRAGDEIHAGASRRRRIAEELLVLLGMTGAPTAFSTGRPC